MDRTVRFTCPCCGEEYEGAPSLAFKAPDSWAAMPEAERGADTRLQSDFCMVEARDYFIRCTIDIPILDSPEPFTWGIWIRVGYDDFMDYWNHYEDHDRPGGYEGRLANRLPRYPDTLGLAGSAILRPGGARPKFKPHPSPHPLYVDYSDGISWDTAIEIARFALPGLHT